MGSLAVFTMLSIKVVWKPASRIAERESGDLLILNWFHVAFDKTTSGQQWSCLCTLLMTVTIMIFTRWQTAAPMRNGFAIFGQGSPRPLSA